MAGGEHRPTRSASHRYVLAAAVALPVAIFAIVMATLSAEQQRESVAELLRQVARSSVGAIDNELGNRLAVLRTLATSEQLDRDLVAFRRQVEQAVAGREGWANIWLTEPASSAGPVSLLAAPVGDAAALLDPGDIAAVAHSGVPVIAGMPERPRSAGRFIALHVPVLRRGEVRSVLSAAVGPATFSKLLIGQGIPTIWTAAVLDRDYTIVGRSRAQGEFVGTRATSSLTKEIEQASERVFVSLTKEGERVYTVFSRSPYSGWTLAIGAPETAIDQPLGWTFMAAAGGGAIALLLALLLVIVLLRNHARREDAERQLLVARGEQAAEQRLSEIAENFPGVIFRRAMHPDGRISYPYLSDGVEALVGAPASAFKRPMTLEDLARYTMPEDLARSREVALQSAASLDPYNIEMRIIAPDGEVRWMQAIARPQREADGTIVWDGVALDITTQKQSEEALQREIVERKRIEEHQRLLMAELDHRVKNTLATVQSVAVHSLPSGQGVETFMGRLSALARAHSLLAESRWQGGRLGALIETELAPYRGGAQEQVVIEGEEMLLRPKAAQLLAMVLHELITNAAKYGALSIPEGRLALSWRIEERGGGGQRLTLRWVERNGPPVRAPTRRGFGSMLIERSLEYELRGDVRLDFLAAGVECVLEVPLDEARLG